MMTARPMGSKPSRAPHAQRAGVSLRCKRTIPAAAGRLGASGEALPGLAGVGDLLLTCTSPLSRNYTVGFRIAANAETWPQIKVPTRPLIGRPSRAGF
jgi:hypothetical protein